MEKAIINNEKKSPVDYFSNYLSTNKAKEMMEKIFTSKAITSIKNEDIDTLIKDWKNLNQMIISKYGYVYNTEFVQAVFRAMVKHGYNVHGYSPKKTPIAMEDGTGIHNRIYFYNHIIF